MIFEQIKNSWKISPYNTKSGVPNSPLLLFRKSEFFHTFSVIRQHKNYTECMEEVGKFSKKQQRTAVLSTFGVASLSSSVKVCKEIMTNIFNQEE